MFTPENEAKLSAAGILEIAEVLKFGADIISGVHQAREDDGKVSVMEGAVLAVKIVGNVRDAVTGARAIPEELRHMDGARVEMLGDVIWPAFIGYPSHQRALLNAGLGAVREFANFYSVYVTPPKALPVP